MRQTPELKRAPRHDDAHRDDEQPYAWAWLAANGRSPDTVLEYLAMLKYQRLGQGPLDPALQPHRVLGIPENVREDKALAEQVAWQFNGAMFFLLCHEVGHLVLQHRSTADVTTERSRHQEGEADAFALEMMRSVGQPADGVLFYFLFVSVLGTYHALEGGDKLKSLSTHPVSTDRIQTLIWHVQTHAADFVRVQADLEAAQRYYRAWAALADQAVALAGDTVVQRVWRALGRRATPDSLKPRTLPAVPMR